MNKHERDELSALIPEYVNGTLNEEDSKRLETALENSPELHEMLERERLLKARIEAGTDSLLDSAEQNTETRLSALLAKEKEKAAIAATKPEPVAAKTDKAKPAKFASMLALLNPRRWHPAVALSLALAIPAQAAIITAQTATIASLEDENFQLASGPCAKDIGKSAILIEFRDDVRWSDISGLLSAESLAIVKLGDFGTLSLRSKSEGKVLQEQIERLRSSPLVSSAEPGN